MYIDKFLLILVFGEVCVMLWYDHVFDRAVRWDLVLLFNIVQLVVGENNRVAKVEEDDKRCNRFVVRKAITISSSK